MRVGTAGEGLHQPGVEDVADEGPKPLWAFEVALVTGLPPHCGDRVWGRYVATGMGQGQGSRVGW